MRDFPTNPPETMSPTPRPRFELTKETDTRRRVIGKFNSLRDLKAEMENAIRSVTFDANRPDERISIWGVEYGRDRRGYICTDVVTLRP